jgi:hypothetical protein
VTRTMPRATRHYGTVEKLQSFDVHTLYRAGALQEDLVKWVFCSFRWPGIVRVACNRWLVDVVFRGGAQQRIPLVWSWCHFGGARPWFICTRCDRRVGKLYNSGASLACRQCRDLRYSSQRRGAKSRSYLQALKLRLRLNDIATIGGPIPERPRRMHRQTYYRLCRRLEELEKKLGPRFRLRETDYGPLVPK